MAVVDWLNKSAAVGHVFFIQMGLQNKLPHFLFVKNLASTQPLFEIKTLAYQIDLDDALATRESEFRFLHFSALFWQIFV